MSSMARYKVLLRGDNFLLNLDGDHSKFGFYATRIVKSASLEEAEKNAVIRIRHELNKSRFIVKDLLYIPNVSVEKSEMISFFHFSRKKNLRGFKFHKEEEFSSNSSAQ